MHLKLAAKLAHFAPSAQYSNRGKFSSSTHYKLLSLHLILQNNGKLKTRTKQLSNK